MYAECRPPAALAASVECFRQVGAVPNWGALAHGLGFADQSHLVNEFRALAGLTPTAWFLKFQDGAGDAG
jgi:AraC-like DNA-binding protein